jgi:hypothetical protein
MCRIKSDDNSPKVSMIKRCANALVIILLAAGLYSCGKMHDKLQEINPEHVAFQFFEAWKKKDWKALYQLSHPAFMQRIRLQKLAPEQRSMSDQELFVREFERVQMLNPDKILKTYQIESISEYHKGDTTVWVSALVNGKKKKIPLTLDGLSLKIDLTRID